MLLNQRLFFSVTIFFFIIFFSKVLFVFDEEFLVVCSFFIVFSLLVHFLSGTIKNELDSRSTLLENQFLKFYNIKKDVLSLIISYYKLRNNSLVSKIGVFFDSFYLVFISILDRKLDLLITYNSAILNKHLFFVYQQEIVYILKSILINFPIFSNKISQDFIKLKK